MLAFSDAQNIPDEIFHHIFSLKMLRQTHIIRHGSCYMTRHKKGHRDSWKWTEPNNRKKTVLQWPKSSIYHEMCLRNTKLSDMLLFLLEIERRNNFSKVFVARNSNCAESFSFALSHLFPTKFDILILILVSEITSERENDKNQHASVFSVGVKRCQLGPYVIWNWMNMNAHRIHVRTLTWTPKSEGKC